jgi:hypothetical protein
VGRIPAKQLALASASKVKSGDRSASPSPQQDEDLVIKGESMRVKTSIKAGGQNLNHNQTTTRDNTKAKSLKVKTNIKAGGVNLNHSETMARELT